MISREAQIVALIHFATGRSNEVTFGRKRFEKLPDQHLRGLAELEAAGMIFKTEKSDRIIYVSRQEIGCPIRDFREINEEEAWIF